MKKAESSLQNLTKPEADTRPHVHHYQNTHHWIDTHAVRIFVGCIVILNAATLGLLTFSHHPQTIQGVLVALNYFTIFVFVMEIALRFIAHHRHFFHHPWNVFDFSVVVLSLIPSIFGISILEGVCVLRLLYFVEFSKNLKHILFGMYYAFPGFVCVFFLIVMIFYIYAIIGISLFQHPGIPMFQNIGTTFHGLFRVLTGDGWYDSLRKTETLFPYSWIYFYSYFLVMVMTTLNLFVGVVVTALQSAEADIELPRKNSQRDWMNQLSLELRDIKRIVNEMRTEQIAALNADKKSAKIKKK